MKLLKKGVFIATVVFGMWGSTHADNKEMDCMKRAASEMDSIDDRLNKLGKTKPQKMNYTDAKDKWISSEKKQNYHAALKQYEKENDNLEKLETTWILESLGCVIEYCNKHSKDGTGQAACINLWEKWTDGDSD